MTDQQPSQPPAYEPSTGARVFGWLLVVLGGAWTLLSGGCTLMFLTMPFGGGGSGGDEALNGVLLLLGIGAVCILPGIGLLYGGWVILRRRRPKAQ